MRRAATGVMLAACLAAGMASSGTGASAATESSVTVGESLSIQSSDQVYEARDQARQRAELGLAADAETVQALIAGWESRDAGTVESARTLMTPSERAAIEHLESVATESVTALRTYDQARNGEILGGLYIDWSTKKLVVLLHRQAQEQESALRSLINSPQDVRIELVDHLLRDLDHAHEVILAEGETLAVEGLHITHIATDEKMNRLEVGVRGDMEDAMQRLAEIVDPALLRLVGPSTRTFDGVEGLNSPPLKGGQGITRVVSATTLASCTSAFITYNATVEFGIVTSKRYFMVTAGHCGNGTWSQASSYLVGTSDRNSFVDNSPADAMRIPMRAADQTASVAITPTFTRIMSASENRASDLVGDRVCVSGARTGGESCGTLQNRNFSSDPADPQTLVRQRLATYTSQGGDSGGSVYLQGLAKGVHSSRYTFSDGTVLRGYGHIGEALPALGITFLNR